MKRFMFLVVSAAALCLFVGIATTASYAQISFATYQVTDNAADDGAVDVAVDPDGNTHAVYVRGGNVYYKKNLGSEELVGAGSGPAIGVSPAGVPHVIYLAGGNGVYKNRTGSSWSPGVNMMNAAMTLVDIDVDGAGKAHIVYVCDSDGDGYNEVFYANNIVSGFTEWPLADGSYSYGSGTYYYNPCIKVAADGAYRVVMEQQQWGGRASWSSKSILFLTPTATIGSEGYEWNTGVTTGRNSLALDGSGNAHVLYYSNGIILHAMVNGSWTGAPLAAGTEGAIAATGSTIAVAFRNGGDNIAYTQDIGAGFTTPQIVDAGRYPSIALNGARHIMYEKSDGVDQEIYLAADETPLPIQLASFIAVPNGREVSLQWRTVSEMDNYGFYVQRLGKDGVTYADIAGAFIAGRGTTTEATVYTYVDTDPQGDAWYRLRQVDLDGRVHFSEPVRSSGTTDVATTGPVGFSLSQNYPNPFNPATQIAFSIATAGQTRLVVYDQLGREVATLVHGEMPAGQHTVSFTAAGCASGVYFARLTSGGTSSMIRMLLMR